MIREVTEKDFNGLSDLYTHLHNNKPVPFDDKTEKIWKEILADKNHHVIVAEEDGKIVSSCVLVVVPNLTHNQQPYGLIENVVTNKDYRKRGLASQCMAFAKQIARENNCYKIMLLTGTRKRSTHRFYRKNGYNSIEKTGYIQRL